MMNKRFLLSKTQLSISTQRHKICIEMISVLFCLCHLVYAGWVVPHEIGYIEKAVFAESNGEIFLRLQGSAGIGDPYGAFVFDRNTLAWQALGNNAVSAVDSFVYKNQVIKSLQFFTPLKSEEFAIDYTGKMRFDNKKYLIRNEGMQIQITEIVNRDSIYYVSAGQVVEIDKWLISRFKYFDGDNLWFTVVEVLGESAKSIVLGYFDIKMKEFNFLDLKDYGTKEYPMVRSIAKCKEELWIGTYGMSSGWEYYPGYGIFIFDLVNKKFTSNITMKNSPVPSNHIVSIQFDDSDCWIATAKGVALWQRQSGKWYTYQVDTIAVIYGNPPKKVGPYTEHTSLGFFKEGEEIRLLKSFDDGFFVSNMDTVSAWIYRKAFAKGQLEQFKIVEDTITLYGKINFYSKPDKESIVIADYRSDDFAYTTKYEILETLGDWLRVKLDRLWVPVQNVKCRLSLVIISH